EIGGGAAAEDVVGLVPETRAGHGEPLGRRVVAELPDGALLERGEGGLHLEPREHGEGKGTEHEVAVDANELAVLVPVDGGGAPSARILLETHHLGAHARLRLEPDEEARGQPVDTTRDLIEAFGPQPILLLPQVLSEGAAEEGLDAVG